MCSLRKSDVDNKIKAASDDNGELKVYLTNIYRFGKSQLAIFTYY